MVPQYPPPSTAAADSDPFKNFFHTFLTTYPITSFFWLLIFIFLLMVFLHLAWRDCGPPCLRMIDRTLKAREERNNKNVLKVLPPAVKYKTSEEERMKPCTGCAICLEDFKDGELCQVLPFCYHAFHSDCINPWLITKQSCPNCRAPVHPQT